MQHLFFLGYIGYLLLIISIVFFDRKKPMQRFGWLLLLTFLPVVGLVLYAFVGSERFMHYRQERIRTRHEKILQALEKLVYPVKDGVHAGTASKPLVFHKYYCDSVLTADNKVEMMTTGAAKYDRLFQDLRDAERHIHVQYFTIHNDPVGREFIDILMGKAAQGVEVKLLYDGIGCLVSYVFPLFRALREAGGKVAVIRPRLLDLNYRNHRKLVIIDGQVGYTGGMNIGAKYRFGVEGRAWRDTHLRLTGSGVHYLQQVFLFDWVISMRGDTIGLRYPLQEYFPRPQLSGTLALQVVANELYNKFRNDDTIILGYFTIMARAQRRLWIQTPYFAPSDMILQTLKALAVAGVDVRIVTSDSYSGGGLFHRSITNYFLRYLVDSGVRVFRYDGIMHAKTLLVDDQGAAIGSVNLNARSLERDDELYVYSESPQFVSQHVQILRSDFGRCTEMDYHQFAQQSLGSRVAESVLSFFSPLS